MSKYGKFTCHKELTGVCDVLREIELGGTYTSQLVLTNGSGEEKKVCVIDELPVLGESMVFTSEATGGAEGATSGEGPIGDAVTLPPGSSVTYDIMVTVGECEGTSTNVAYVWCLGDKRPKAVAAEPIIVGCPDLKVPIQDNGSRPFNADAFLHGFLGVGSNAAGQTLLDLCESGVTLVQLLTNPSIAKALENGAPDSPEEKFGEG